MNLGAQSDGFFSTLIHWKHRHAFYYSFTPDAYSLPLCKLGQGISYLYSLRFFQGLRPSESKASPAFFLPSLLLRLLSQHREGGTAPEFRSHRSAMGERWTPKREMTMFPCCPPVAMPRPVSRSGTLPKIPLFLYEDCLRLALHLDCFPRSNVVAFTKTIGAFMWREHGYAPRS